jgi:hypothetical protein
VAATGAMRRAFVRKLALLMSSPAAAICANAGGDPNIGTNASSGSQSLAIEFEHRRPVALGGGWVEDGHIRDREAMTCAGISLDQMVHPCLGQSLFEAALLFLGKTRVLDSTSDVDTAGYIFREEMRAVWLLRGEIAAVKRRDRRKSAWNAPAAVKEALPPMQ